MRAKGLLTVFSLSGEAYALLPTFAVAASGNHEVEGVDVAVACRHACNGNTCATRLYTIIT